MNKEDIEKILRSAGWYPNRKAKIDKSINRLQERGYCISKAFISFFQEFGGITVRCKVKERDRMFSFNIKDSFDIDYDEVIINDYPKIIEAQCLTLVGNVDGTSVLAISEKGIIYSLYGGSVMIIGAGYNALENLVSIPWREMKEYDIPDWW